jgi:hypothetical protein
MIDAVTTGLNVISITCLAVVVYCAARAGFYLWRAGRTLRSLRK